MNSCRWMAYSTAARWCRGIVPLSTTTPYSQSDAIRPRLSVPVCSSVCAMSHSLNVCRYLPKLAAFISPAARQMLRRMSWSRHVTSSTINLRTTNIKHKYSAADTAKVQIYHGGLSDSMVLTRGEGYFRVSGELGQRLADSDCWNIELLADLAEVGLIPVIVLPGRNVRDELMLNPLER